MQMRCPGCLLNGNPVPFDASCLNLNRKIMRKSARPAIRNNTSSNSNSNSNSNSASDSNSNNSTKPRTTTAEFQGVFPYIVNLCRQFWFVSATNFFFCDLFPVRRRCQRCVFTCNHYHPPEETEVTSYLIQKFSPPPCFSQESFKFVSLLRLRPTKTRAARSEILGAECGACCRGLWILWGGCGKIWHLRVRTMILLLVKQERMFRNLEIPVSGACWIEETVTSETSKLWALAKKGDFPCQLAFLPFGSTNIFCIVTTIFPNAHNSDQAVSQRLQSLETRQTESIQVICYLSEPHPQQESKKKPKEKTSCRIRMSESSIFLRHHGPRFFKASSDVVVLCLSCLKHGTCVRLPGNWLLGAVCAQHRISRSCQGLADSPLAASWQQKV